MLQILSLMFCLGLPGKFVYAAESVVGIEKAVFDFLSKPAGSEPSAELRALFTVSSYSRLPEITAAIHAYRASVSDPDIETKLNDLSRLPTSTWAGQRTRNMITVYTESLYTYLSTDFGAETGRRDRLARSLARVLAQDHETDTATIFLGSSSVSLMAILIAWKLALHPSEHVLANFAALIQVANNDSLRVNLRPKIHQALWTSLRFGFYGSLSGTLLAPLAMVAQISSRIDGDFIVGSFILANAIGGSVGAVLGWHKDYGPVLADYKAARERHFERIKGLQVLLNQASQMSCGSRL